MSRSFYELFFSVLALAQVSQRFGIKKSSTFLLSIRFTNALCEYFPDILMQKKAFNLSTYNLLISLYFLLYAFKLKKSNLIAYP
jgi:predicted transporter